MGAHLERARLLLEQDRCALAQEEAALGLAEAPDDPHAHALMALCLTRLERYEEATEHAQQAVGLAPDAAGTHYVLATVWATRRYFDEAMESIEEAIALEPDNADYWALRGRIELARRRWKDALAAADAALALDAEHVEARNVRAEALRLLGKTGEAEEDILDALALAPENAWSHNTLGWNYLQAGNLPKATEHFREALRLDPELDSARQGVVETLKAKNVVYRLFLQYFLWMARLSGRAQWGVIIGAYVGYQIVRRVAVANPSSRVWLTPLIVAYVLFAMGTWFAVPLSNLFLRLHPFGRLALSRDERVTSAWFGAVLLIFLAAGAAAVVAPTQSMGPAATLLFLMLIPVAATSQAPRPWPRKPLLWYTIVLAVLAGTALLRLFLVDSGAIDVGADGTSLLATVGGIALVLFVLGGILSPWVGNYLIMRAPYRKR